jgi:hypothetical protein
MPPVPSGPFRAHLPVDKSILDKMDIHVFELHVNENIADEVISVFYVCKVHFRYGLC